MHQSAPSNGNKAEASMALARREETLPRLQLQDVDIIDLEEDATTDTGSSTASSPSGVTARHHRPADRVAAKLEQQVAHGVHDHDRDLHLTTCAPASRRAAAWDLELTVLDV